MGANHLVQRIFASSLRLAFCLLFLSSGHLCPVEGQPNVPVREPLTLDAPLQDKNFYLFSLIERSSAVRSAVESHPALARLTAKRAKALTQVAMLTHQPACTYVMPLMWTPEEINEVGDALRELYRSNADVRKLADQQLPASGIGVPASTVADSLVKTWQLEAAGMNRILAAYGEGKSFPHSDLDGLVYDSNSQDYSEFLQQLASDVSTQANKDNDAGPFFATSLQFCLELLKANQRDEAARFEPMEQGENRAAASYLKKVNWSKYRYAAILVPGMGPDTVGIPLSPMGRLRVEKAARAYRLGLAPFLLLSGGYVHPRQTPFSEAVEMKKVLIHDFHIPEEAILIDPHARHTTKNLRNAARILFRDGFPLDRPVAILSDIFQIDYIASTDFAARCDRELGYRPFQKLIRVQPDELQWQPDYYASLVQDPRDPLDP
jgi:hypothetical protein